MSKKDYQAIAAAMYRVQASGWKHANGTGCVVDFTRVLDELIPVLRGTNPRFNAELFREACETGRCRGMRPVAA